MHIYRDDGLIVTAVNGNEGRGNTAAAFLNANFVKCCSFKYQCFGMAELACRFKGPTVYQNRLKLECAPMPNVMVATPNIGPSVQRRKV